MEIRRFQQSEFSIVNGVLHSGLLTFLGSLSNPQRTMRNTNLQYFAYLFLIGVLAALTRVLPHPPNFAPMTAVALFAGFAFRNIPVKLFYTIATMFFSDLLLEIFLGIGIHAGMLYVYPTLILITFLGSILRKKFHFLTAAGMTFASSIVFFLLTNFFVWLTSGMYPLTLDGLILCYTLALPFLHNAIAGDLIYATILFTSYFVLLSRIPSLRTSPNTVLLQHS